MCKCILCLMPDMSIAKTWSSLPRRPPPTRVCQHNNNGCRRKKRTAATDHSFWIFVLVRRPVRTVKAEWGVAGAAKTITRQHETTSTYTRFHENPITRYHRGWNAGDTMSRNPLSVVVLSCFPRSLFWISRCHAIAEDAMTRGR